MVTALLTSASVQIGARRETEMEMFGLAIMFVALWVLIYMKMNEILEALNELAKILRRPHD